MDFLPSPAQLDDWLVARWALLRIDSLRDALPEKAAALEALFTPETVRGLVDRERPDALLLLFRVLSAQALRPLCDELLERWPKAPRVLGWHIAERLAEIAPEQVTSRLEEWLEGHPLEYEVLSLTSLAGTLTRMPPGHGAALAGKLADFAIGFGDVYLLDLLRPELIELGRRHGLPQTPRLVEGLFEPGHVNRYLHTDALLHGYEALTGGRPYYDLFLRRVGGETEQGLEPLAPLFLPEAPIGAIQAAFLQGPQAALDRLDALLPPEPNAMGSLARTLLERGRSFGETPSRDASSVFLVALACAAWAREKPDWAALSAAQIAGLGVTDLASLPDAEGALERLRELPRAEVCASLEAALLENEESSGAATLVSWMGGLRYSELLQPLRASLDSSLNEKLADAAAEALRCFGAEAEPDLVARWEDLTEAQQKYGARLLSLCGGEATVGLLVSRHADLDEDDPCRLWTRMAWGLPDARLVEILEEKLDEEWVSDDVEEAYVMQCLLLERTGDSLGEIRENVEHRLFPDDDEEEDDFELPRTPPLFVELRCAGCGTASQYEDPKIYVDFDRPSDRPVVAGELECASCGEAEGLQPTAAGLETLRQRCEEIETKGLSSRSLKSLPIQLMNGRQVPLGAALSTYEQALERQPGSAVDLFMLARCSQSAGYGRKAAQLFRECLASEPAYVQAALDLALLLESWQTEGPALEVLEEAVRHKGRWQLFRTVDFPTEADLKRAYVRLYNRLREAAQDDSRPALHVSDLATVKAGRNDPCPCGSGKKYKKCCLLKEQ